MKIPKRFLNNKKNTKQLFFILILFCSLCTLQSCFSPFTIEEIQKTKYIDIENINNVIIESSSSIIPSWINRSPLPSKNKIPFIGYGKGNSLDDAKNNAKDDLKTNISNYISVDVESDAQMLVMMKASIDEKEERRKQRFLKVKKQSQSFLKSLKETKFYWNKKVKSVLDANSPIFEYYSYSEVDLSEILKARQKRNIERKKENGKEIIVILPFRNISKDENYDFLSFGISNSISENLKINDNFMIYDYSNVANIIKDFTKISFSNLIVTLSNVLCPDYLISGSFQIHNKKVKLIYRVINTFNKKTILQNSKEILYKDLLESQTEISNNIKAIFKIDPKAKNNIDKIPKTNDISAYEYYQKSYLLFSKGKNEEAIQMCQKAINIDKKYIPAYIRMGRIYQRLGKYYHQRYQPQNHHSVNISIYDVYRVYVLLLLKELENIKTEDDIKNADLTFYNNLYKELSYFIYDIVFNLRTPHRYNYSNRYYYNNSYYERHQMIKRNFSELERELQRYLDNYNVPDNERSGYQVLRSIIYELKIFNRQKNQAAYINLTRITLEAKRYFESNNNYSYNFDDALSNYQKAFELSVKLDNDIYKTDMLISLADIYFKLGNLQSSSIFYMIAKQFAIKINNNRFLSEVFVGLAKIDNIKNLEISALERLKKALLIRSLLNSKPLIIDVYNNIASVFFKNSKFGKADYYLKKAFKISKQIDNEQFIGAIKNNIGIIQIKNGNIASANDNLKAAEKAFTKLNETDNLVSNKINQAYLKTLNGNYYEARRLYDEAKILLAKTSNKYKYAIIYNHLGFLSLQENKIDEAYGMINAAIIQFSDLNLFQNINISTNNKACYLYAKKDYEKAYFDLLYQSYKTDEISHYHNNIVKHNLNCIKSVFEYDEPFDFSSCTKFIICGGAAAGKASMAEAPKAGAIRVKKEEYDKGIEAFVQLNESMIILTKDRLEEESFIEEKHAKDFEDSISHFSSNNHIFEKGIATLNAGVARLYLENYDKAFNHFNQAKKIFASCGYLLGLAYAYEWTSHLFIESGEDDLALEEMRFAYQIFKHIKRNDELKRIEKMF